MRSATPVVPVKIVEFGQIVQKDTATKLTYEFEEGGFLSSDTSS